MIWSTQRDRARIAEAEARRDDYAARAATAATDAERARYERLTRTADRQVRVLRTYPPSIWLGGIAVVVPLLVWAVAKRHGHGTAGLVAAVALGLAEALTTLRGRRGRVGDPTDADA